MIDDRPPGGASTRHDGRSEMQLPTFWPPLPFWPPYDAAPGQQPRGLREPGARAGADVGGGFLRWGEWEWWAERGQLHLRPAVVPRAGAARGTVVDHLRVTSGSARRAGF